MNNLTKVNEEFKLNLEWNRPRPQIMDGAVKLNLILTKSFVEKEGESYLGKTEILIIDLTNEHEAKKQILESGKNLNA